MQIANVTRRNMLAALTAAALWPMPIRCLGNGGRPIATEEQGVDDRLTPFRRPIFDFHLKSFDPRYRRFLIALTRAEHCWDQRYSEELLEETVDFADQVASRTESFPVDMGLWPIS